MYGAWLMFVFFVVRDFLSEVEIGETGRWSRPEIADCGN